MKNVAAFSKFLLLVFLINLFLNADISYAMVNLQRGSFEWSTKVLHFQIVYNSQSLHQGWWGLGWCSDLELEIGISKEGQDVRKCGQILKGIEIEATKEGYLAHLPKVIAKFDKVGRLYDYQESGKERIRINWAGGFPKEFTIGPEIFSVQKTSIENRIQSIKSSNFDISFIYQLDQVAKIGSQSLFKYDENSNLVSIEDQGQTLTIFYDALEDRVLQVNKEQGCSTTYSYRETRRAESLSLFTQVQRSCGENFFQTRSVEAQFKLVDSAASLFRIQEKVL